MTPQEFMANFGTLADAPGGIKKLRELVLSLAVRGRLTATAIGTDAALSVPTIIGDPTRSVFGPLPKPWAVKRLGDLAEVLDPNPSHRYPTYKAGRIPLLSTREFRSRDGWNLDDHDLPMVPPAIHAEQNERCHFSPSDIIFARKGRLGLARLPPPIPAYVFSHTLFVIKTGAQVRPEYLLWYLRAESVVQWLRREMNDNTGVPTLGKGTTERLPVPLPPLPEQKRIVAKVDQLMALLDELEAKQGKWQKTVVRATTACLDALTTADSPEEVADAWKRVAGNWRVLFDRVEAVGELRKAVLGLAVVGRLASPGPDDERPAAWKDVNAEPPPAELTVAPERWVWTRLKHVCSRVSVGHVGPTSQHYCAKENGIAFLRSQNVRPRHLDLSDVRYVTRAFHEKLKKSQLFPGDLLFVRVGANRGDCCFVPPHVGVLNCANIVFARPHHELVPFLEMYCQSPHALLSLGGMTTGSAQGVINTKSVAELVVPLPPLAEQKRIVARVNQFMAVCDDLEAKLRRRDDRAGRLVEAVVGEMAAG